MAHLSNGREIRLEVPGRLIHAYYHQSHTEIYQLARCPNNNATWRKQNCRIISEEEKGAAAKLTVY